MRGIDVVFHLAALISIPYSYEAPRSYVRTNVEGAANVLQAALSAEVSRFIHISTSEVYGSARYVPIPETHPLQAQSPYAASKIGADQLAESFHLSFGFPVVVVRPFNTYGPRQSARAIIPTIITQAVEGKEIRVGNLHPTRDFNYVADTVEGMMRAAGVESAIGTTVNIGSGFAVSIEELASLIADIVGSKARLVIDDERLRPPKSEVERLCADRTLAKKLLDWEPKYDLKEGLARTIEWISANMKVYRSGHYAR
jgi:dTDP-glucose 4,6-dehydratase